MRRLAFASTLALAACTPPPDQPVAVDDTMVTDMNATDDMEIVEQPAPREEWIVNDSIDAISDARVLSATTRIEGRINDVEVSARCTPKQATITYLIAGFGKDGSPAALDKKFSGGEIRNYVTYRADTAPASYASTADPTYDNQTQIEDGWDAGASVAAKASNWTLRLQFANIEETYMLDQRHAAFRNVVEPCLRERQARADKFATEQAKRQAEQQALAAQAMGGEVGHDPLPADMGNSSAAEGEAVR